MSVRSTCKALVIHEGKVLLNRCHDAHNGEYYSLPGGGQETEEFLEEAIIREVREETGYTVIPEMFVGIGEEICDDPVVHEKWPDYIHKMYHIYRCSLDTDVPRIEPTEVDDMQDDCQWVDLERIHEVALLPQMVKDKWDEMVKGQHPVFLDSVRLEYHHG